MEASFCVQTEQRIPAAEGAGRDPSSELVVFIMKICMTYAVCILLLAALIAPFGAGALTDGQKETLVSYTDRFIEDGNAPISDKNRTGYLQYGVKEVWRTYQLFLSFNYEVYTTTPSGSRQKILFMMNPDGYTSYDLYADEISRSPGGYLKPGNYLCLDCSAFVAWIYKAVFGLRFDYAETGNNSIRNWSTLHYLGSSFAYLRKVTTDRGVTALFRDVWSKIDPKGGIAFSDLCEIQNKLEVGDILVGRNSSSDWGHIMFYGGDGYIYQSSSTPQVMPDGSLNTHLIRRQLLSELTNAVYTEIHVLRISDGVIPEDFDGWNVPVDFASLSTSRSQFDSTAPAFIYIDIEGTYNPNGTKTVTLRATDEFGDMKPLYLADGTTVIRGSAYGESGVLGIYINETGTLPEDLYEFSATRNTYSVRKLADGVHYIWARDAAENVSQRLTVTIGETSTVTRREADGSETLIARFSENGKEIVTPLVKAKEAATSAAQTGQTEDPGDDVTETEKVRSSCRASASVFVLGVCALAAPAALARKERGAGG